MKRVLYLGYFIKNTDYRELKSCFRDAKEHEKKLYLSIFFDMLKSSFKYKSSFHDYFMFDFYKKNHRERETYLTTGGSYEFYTTLNQKEKINIFREKAKFNAIFKEFIRRDFFLLNNKTASEFVQWLNDREVIIAKPNYGVAGRGIEKIRAEEYDDVTLLYDYLKGRKLDLVEEEIEQHPCMAKLNSSSVNTIRVITVRWKENTEIVAAILRIGRGGPVDNFSAGGIAAPINITTGKVYMPAVSKMGNKEYEYHPETGCKINGFAIPYWQEVLDMVSKASTIVPEVRTVGWDIAITEKGPELIEGNDNWDKDLFQLPYKEGRKHLLEKYTGGEISWY